MHKTGNVVVEGVAIGKIQFLNADYEEQIKRYMTGTEEEEKKRYQEAHTLAKDDLESLLEDRESLSESEIAIEGMKKRINHMSDAIEKKVELELYEEAIKMVSAKLGSEDLYNVF